MSIPVKKTLIILIYLLIFSSIGFLIYLKYKPKPNCFDNILNQNEERVDCGGVCAQKCEILVEENIKVDRSGYVESGTNGQYDLYAEITNPNNFFGSSQFNYKFEIKNSAGAVVAAKTGNNFIFPGESKYIIENNVGAGEIPYSVDFSVSDPIWVEFTSDYLQKPELKVVNKQYNEITSGVGFSEAKGLVKNESPFDFTAIKVEIILKDNNGQIIALNSTQMGAVRSGENRDFRVIWPSRFPGSVSNMEVQTEVNMFDSEAFMKRYFKNQKFQEY